MKQRLDQELVGNVSLRILPTSRPDTCEVQGRGELQLAVLVEIMRREGFELTVGNPEACRRASARRRAHARSATLWSRANKKSWPCKSNSVRCGSFVSRATRVDVVWASAGALAAGPVRSP